jgi:hypothetical protein
VISRGDLYKEISPEVSGQLDNSERTEFLKMTKKQKSISGIKALFPEFHSY